MNARENRFLPGCGRFQVGQCVFYAGAPRVFHPGQREVETGETAVIVHDFGWNYRYLIRLDRRSGIRSYHTGGGVIFDIRPGNIYAWQPSES
jgi:triacylglycerol esterase/lipase EstA (alpha/beta hydrolase family)